MHYIYRFFNRKYANEVPEENILGNQSIPSPNCLSEKLCELSNVLLLTKQRLWVSLGYIVNLYNCINSFSLWISLKLYLHYLMIMLNQDCIPWIEMLCGKLHCDVLKKTNHPLQPGWHWDIWFTSQIVSIHLHY